MMLQSTCEFLNFKTLGEGIVKTVGLDQSATELLTGSEIDAFKANLELRALTVAEIAYLIRGKIKREGIAARNVFASVIANREQWIYQQLNDIEVSL